ncbi:MAG: hypothetical protein V4726_00945 [Verrucomicrobiota bacterium]
MALLKFFADLFSGQRALPVVNERLKLATDRLAIEEQKSKALAAEILELKAELKSKDELLKKLRDEVTQLSAELQSRRDSIKPDRFPDLHVEAKVILRFLAQIPHQEVKVIAEEVKLSKNVVSFHLYEMLHQGKFVAQNAGGQNRGLVWSASQNGLRYLHERGILK